MGTIGYKPTGGTPDFLRLDQGNPANYRAYKPDPAIENGWATTLSARIGKLTATAPECRLIVFTPHSDPREIEQQTASFFPNVLMTDGSGGSLWTLDLPATFKIFSGDSFELGAIAMSPGAGLGMIQAAILQGEGNDTFWSRDDGAMPPADPMGWTSSSFEGWMAIYLSYDKNLAPNTPTGQKLNGIAGNNLVSPTFTPTFEWDFSDPNETLSNGLSADYLNKVEILVTRASDGATMWSLSDVGTSAERSARHITRTYAGSALSSSDIYQWQGRHSDRMGLFSDWSAPLTFTVGAGQVVVTGTGLGTPAGKQETNTPGPFVAKWTHSGGLSTTAVQIQLLDATNNPISGYVSGDIPKVVANNGTISVAWADPGAANAAWFASPLNWGGVYAWQMRGKASDGNYSGWSAPVAFTTDEAPSVPTQLTPDGVAITTRPTLSCKSSDVDDTVATGLVVKAEIFNASNTLLGTYAMSLRGGTTDTWDLVTTSTHLPSLQAYSWRAYAGDGTLWSGRQTAEASAVRSATAQFTYAAGPSLSITTPTDGSTIATATPVLAWTAATQAAYQVRVYDATGGAKLFDTGQVVSTTTTFTVPAGIIDTVGAVYRLQVDIWDASALQNSASVTVTFSITQPSAPAGWLLAPVTLEGDDVAAGEASAVLISFEPSSDPNFLYYLIQRQPASGAPQQPWEAARSTPWVKIFREYDRNTTRFIDYSPASGVAYQYRVTQFTQVGSTTLNSPYQLGEIMVTFSATILYDVTDPEGTRVVLPYRGTRVAPRRRDLQFIKPWGRQLPTALRSDLWYPEVTASYPVTGLTQDQVNAVFHQLDVMDAFGADVCFRYGRGFRAFGNLSDNQPTDPEGGKTRSVTLTFTPTDYVEDV
jgi:hypothetical protein